MSLKIRDIEKEYTIEIALIILILRYYFQTATFEEVSAFIEERRDKINWQKFKSLAAYHRIRPLVFKQLVKLNNINPEFKKELVEDIKHFTLTNFQLVYEAKRVIQLFQEQGIRAIPYKGPFLSKAFYGDYDSRESSDIDLLIEWDDLRKCIAILNKEGYVPENELLTNFSDSIKNTENEYNMDFYEKSIRKFHIELHWNVGNPKHHPTSLSLDFLTQILDTKEDFQFIKLSPESFAFTTLFHHFIKDTLGILRNIVDLAKVFSLIDLTSNHEMKNYLIQKSFYEKGNFAIEVINYLLDLQIPHFQSKKGGNLLFFCHLILGSDYKRSIKKDMYYSLRKRFASENLYSAKLEVLKSFCKLILSPNTNDYKWLPLPSRFHWLYFILKPIRLGYQHVFAAFKK